MVFVVVFGFFTVVFVVFGFGAGNVHADHFGGIEGVLPAGPSTVPVIAPAGFMEEATSENVLAGIAMGRRALFMYGLALPRSPVGHVDTGLGKGVPTGGTISIREPTVLIDRTPQELEIDGVRFVFQFAPHSEAPTELTFWTWVPDIQDQVDLFEAEYPAISTSGRSSPAG